MKRARLRPGQVPGTPVEAALARRGLRLRCRDCRAACPKDRAIRAGAGRRRCPACGGVLDGEPNDGQA